MKSIGCVNNGTELLRAIFTLGLACLMPNDTKKEYLNVKADLREEQAIINAIGKRMNYFDDLLGSAHTLVAESEAVLRTTKTFRQALVKAKTILERDYTPDDIEENLGDVDFANDFAEELYKTLHELKLSAEAVSQDCAIRKQNLDNALTGINKYFGEEEEELVQLNGAVTDATVGAAFNKMSDDCSNYFNAVGEGVQAIQNGYIQTVINKVNSIKTPLLLKQQREFSALKIQMFAVLDAAYDVYLKIGSAQYRLQSNAYKINRYIGKRANWYYQHKYSLRTQQNCEMDKGIIAQHVGNLETQFAKFNKMLEKLGKDITGDLTADVQAANQSLKASQHALETLEEPEYEEEPGFFSNFVEGTKNFVKAQARHLFNLKNIQSRNEQLR